MWSFPQQIFPILRRIFNFRRRNFSQNSISPTWQIFRGIRTRFHYQFLSEPSTIQSDIYFSLNFNFSKYKSLFLSWYFLHCEYLLFRFFFQSLIKANWFWWKNFHPISKGLKNCNRFRGVWKKQQKKLIYLLKMYSLWYKLHYLGSLFLLIKKNLLPKKFQYNFCLRVFFGYDLEVMKLMKERKIMHIKYS